MTKRPHPHQNLSRRERQIMDLLYRHGLATAAEIQAGLPDPPSYSTVRALLRILEEKGHIKHRVEGTRYVFLPSVPRETAKRSALRQLIDTFFEGSTAQAVAALLDQTARDLSAEELDRLAELVEKARKEGK
jgi:BlaI family transcriptional regulator, penicillinase repressor